VLLALLGLQGCRAQEPWPLWEAYTKRFIDGQGRVIDRSAPGSQQDRTTSEGQAYAMFFALVDNDKPHFEQLLNWTEANLAGGDLTTRLPAWDWGHTSAGEWKVLDDNSASDADLWMAYTLLEAGRLWHDPRYSKLGALMAARIAREEVVLVPSVGTTLAPGPHGFHPSDAGYVLNPSYLPLPVLAYMAKTMPQGPWGAILDSLPVLLNGEMAHGYAMDWVSADANGVRPAAPPAEPTAGVREPQPAGSYDAIRVYLWLGLADPNTPGEKDLLTQVSGMAGYLRTAANPPLEVDPQGKIVHADGPAGFSAAVIPYLDAEGMKAQAHAQADRLIATRDPASGLYGRAAEYYEQNLALFSTGWSDGKFRFERDGKLHLKWK
jgi:endo-1,4-beta-D-glucanase Y